MGGSGRKRQTVLVLRVESKGMVCGAQRIAALATPRTRLELIGCSWWGADQEKKV